MAKHVITGCLAKYNTAFSNGIIITQNSFSDCDKETVPFLANGGPVTMALNSVIGYTKLHHESDGIYFESNINDGNDALIDVIKNGEMIVGFTANIFSINKLDNSVVNGRIITTYFTKDPKDSVAKIYTIDGEEINMSNDPVNHPSHYTDGKYEVIDFIEDYDLDDDFYMANAVKYICRAGKKDPDKRNEDLQKALWYLQRSVLSKDREERIDVYDFVKDKKLTPNLSEAIVRIAMSNFIMGPTEPWIERAI